VSGGRLHAPHLDALADPTGAGEPVIELRAPAPGLFVPAVATGDLVRPGAAIGRLEVLGRSIELRAPRVGGIVIAPAAGGAAAERAVAYRDVLCGLDQTARAGAGEAAGAPEAADAAADGLAFTAPLSGRFYARPAPGKPAFVKAGDEIHAGQTVCMLEVMKTFNRVTYGGGDLPERARIVEVLVADEDDVTAGQVILTVEETT
jgi:acetyl-CoA carboxylase biotin carboxyl carrier protein